GQNDAGMKDSPGRKRGRHVGQISGTSLSSPTYQKPATGSAPTFCWSAGSADADECSPGRSQSRAGQDISRTVAERAAVSAHLGAERAYLLMACRVKQAGKDKQNTGDEIHRRSPCNPFRRLRYPSDG